MRSLFSRIFFCSRGVHQRDGAKARQDDKGWVSVCVHCDAPVRRAPNRQWLEYTPQV